MKEELDGKLICKSCGEKIKYYECMIADPDYCEECGKKVVHQLRH